TPSQNQVTPSQNQVTPSQNQVTPSQNQVTPIVSYKRGPYKPRKIDIQNATIRRSAQFEDGQNLMVIEERAVNECPMEVVQLVDQETDDQEIPLFLAEEVESINENNNLETPNQQSAPEPK
ncbi:11052_t:CDS:2, partial [Racocetra fulgida]